ncbi:diacylglycerol kinase family protein [Terrimonas sp. NA20]|uniref:Diacylglycerol kinase family protein n=1 Tax=Terrimonas ginsenosidimutans TaxID=2908004 RepID=A0ABS9KZW2_9BACT|nr:diacylglycerol kinase family protein [Terrimonas ginsenosidimutans]MCG2617877.1 diacylglycerol kinase family protein [Terrimonas ginsenosidimutans]
MKQTSLTLRSRMSSFRFAAKGICRFFHEEANAKIHLAATVVVIAGIIWFRITGAELIALVIVTGLVWAAEIMNTAVEHLVDLVSPGFHPKAGLIKDLSAGAVLVLSITALITGLFIFIPKIIHYAV